MSIFLRCWPDALRPSENSIQSHTVSYCSAIKVILQIYTVKATTYNITKYYNTTDSHYSGQCLSKIHSLLPILPSCTKVLSFLARFYWFFSLFWLAAHPWLPSLQLSCFSCNYISALPSVLIAITSLQRA